MDEQNYSTQNEQNNNYQDYTGNQQYSYQPTNQEPPRNQSNVLAIVGMILGIISIPAGCCGWYSLFLGIPGLICFIEEAGEERNVCGRYRMFDYRHHYWCVDDGYGLCYDCYSGNGT